MPRLGVTSVEATQDKHADISCSCVAATLVCFSLGIYSVAPSR